MLVSVDWLAERLSDTRVRVVDVRGQVMPAGSPPPRYRPKREAYDASHVPGAVFVDWTTDIVDLDDPIPAQVAPPAKIAATLGARGIGDGDLVVAYDDYSHVFAGRLAWVLRYHGHDDVRILDGGWNAWVAAGMRVTAELPKVKPATFTPRVRAALRRTADEVGAAIARGALIVDARAAAQYAGEASVAKRAGHIPTARNVPYPTLLEGPERGFLPESRLREVFAAAGIDVAGLPKDREIIVYCNGGVTATVPLTALALLGREDVALYDGSWNEWGNNEARPITAK